MARNQFGCICDICGYTAKNHNQFYKLILPTYKSELNNCTMWLDYCCSCYGELKDLLKKYYNEKNGKEDE